MSMHKCPKCGELYSDTYKTCPFCEEEEALAEGRQLKHRSGGRRVAKKKEPSAVGPVMIIAVILLAVILIYLCFGDRIGAMLGGTDVPASSSEESSSPPSISEEDLLNPDVTAPVVGDDEEDGSSSATGNTGDLTLKDVESLPETLVLSNPDFTLFKKGETTTLSVTGGEGPYTWFSSDEKVVTVSETGVVTAVGDGSATLTVSNGTAKGTGTVYVRGAGATSGSTTTTTGTSTSGTPTLNNTDFTIKVGGTPVPMKVNGTSATVTWSSENPAVATISSDGVVNGVSAGTTNVVAKVGNQTLKCIVRVVK